MLRTADVPVLPAGQAPLRLLHLSDLHLTPASAPSSAGYATSPPCSRTSWSSPATSSATARRSTRCWTASTGCCDLPGAFVLGSNDYFAPILKNPARYLLPDGQDRAGSATGCPGASCRRARPTRGWVDLTNRRGRLHGRPARRWRWPGSTTRTWATTTSTPSRGRPTPADLALGVAHAPYLRVLDRFTADGYAAAAGRAHPRRAAAGARRTARWSPTATSTARRARGLHRHDAGGRTAWLHVSAGLGTSPYAPVRFGCRPEATLLTLVARTA